MLVYKRLTSIILFIVFNILNISLSKHVSANEATLTISKDFKILALNGKPVVSSRFISNILPLKKGSNKLALEYNAVWKEQHNSRVTTVKSKAFIVSFALSSQEKLMLTFLKPANLSASLHFSLDPKIKLIKKTNYSIPLIISSPSSQEINQLLKETNPGKSFKRAQKPIIIGKNKKANPVNIKKINEK